MALRAPHAEHEERLHTVQEIGRAALITWGDIKTQVAFVGETSSALWFAICNPRSVRWKDVWYTCEQVGVNALPIVALIGFLLGLILAFQSAMPMQRFGAEIFVADLVALSMLRELGPLMTAILLAGRSGSAFAAEIGTMKVNEEINALTTMGLEPVRFLVVPRVLAAVLVVPVLDAFRESHGPGRRRVVVTSFGIPAGHLRQRGRQSGRRQDLIGGLAKASVFGILVAGIGCLRGLQTRTAPARSGFHHARRGSAASS